MDDRDLEARLRTHLHHRFDEAQPPRELRASFEQAFATRPATVGTPALRIRAPRLGWSLVVAVAAVAVVAVVGLNLGLHLRPAAGNSPSPSTLPSERSFIVLPPGDAVPSKPDSSAASDVLAARLRALGVGTFTSTTGYAMTFTLLTADGPSDDEVRSILGATGEVSVVPLPPADYGDGQGTGGLTAVVGQPLPKQEPALFGREGIASAAWGDGSPAALDITLTPAASGTLAEWTTGHVGEILAILVDARVIAAPVTREPLVGGSITIDAATQAPFPAEGAAVLIGGILPQSWRPASVVKPISREQAIEAALSQGPGTVESADRDAQVIGGNWRAVWTVVLRGAFPYHCPVPVGPVSSECGSHPGARITVDAIGANVISVEFLSE